MTIKRFDMANEYGTWVDTIPAPDGAYVLYEDHEKIVSDLRADFLARLAELRTETFDHLVNISGNMRAIETGEARTPPKEGT